MADKIPKKTLPSKKKRHKLFGSVEPGPKTKPTTKEEMSDLQNIENDFLFPLDSVGIMRVKYPITVYSSLKPKEQSTIGTFQLSTSIPQTSKGTNMSRFTEQLHIYHRNNKLNTEFSTLKKFTKELAERLEQKDAHIKVEFPWFFERLGPQSDLSGLNHADVTIDVTYDQKKGFSLHGKLQVLIKTLCPCSKDISEYSAHNQRGKVSMKVDFKETFTDEEVDWKKELLYAAESNASAKLHPVLKRPDEKIVTETAYENPRFVEDVVRLVAADLYEMPFVTKFSITCQNYESIHMHDAMASLSFNKQTDKI